MSCERAHLDAAYVLGALSPMERSLYTEHLAVCPQCAESVQRLAGLPGLLARVPLEALEPSSAEEPVPETLLPRLVARVRWRERRRTLLVGLVAASAAAVLTVVTVAVSRLTDSNEATPPAASTPSASAVAVPETPMRPLRSLPVTAQVGLASVPWGTRVELTCTYNRADGSGRPWRYALVVRTRAGEVEHVASWVARPGRTSRITGATASGVDDIVAVEIRSYHGTPLLRLRT